MVRPKRAFHDVNPVKPVEYDLPELDQLNIEYAASAAAAALPRKAVPRELRALDPLQHNSQAAVVPHLPAERLLAQSSVGEFRTVEHATPPLADTRYAIVDQGIADPHVLRLSMYNLPSTKALRDRTSLPLGLIAQPFAAQPEIVDFSNLPDVPRCGRCRAYVNPGTQFAKGGSFMVCNLCHFSTEVPDWYYQPTDANQQRPRGVELSFGSYDIKLPKLYQTGKKSLPLYIFMIDVTRDSLNKGIPIAAGEAILEVLYAQQSLPPGSKVAIMSFAKALHLYRLGKNEDEQVEMLVQYDVEDPVIPPDIFFDPYECPANLEALLKNLPAYFKENWEPNSCFGGALKAGLNALDLRGGRVIAITATMPSVEPGALERRDTRTYTAGAKGAHDPEPQLFLTPSQFYRDLADKFASQGAGCDLFVFPTGYCDLATMSLVSKKSGGTLNAYPRYVAQRDARAFAADLLNVCSYPTYTNCTVKVRTSLGLQVANHWGVNSNGPTGIMDRNSCFAVDFTYDRVLDTRHDAYFQVAVLYTDTQGEPCVRVSNIPAGITDQFKNVLKFVDSDACIGILARQALTKLPEVPLQDIRKGILDKYYQIFAACRSYAGGPLPPSQLLMPTALRCLLPYGNALLKSVVISERSYSVDGRTINTFDLFRASPDELSLLLYPRIYSVEQLFSFDGTDFEDFVMVDASRLALDSCNLMFNGKTITIHVSKLITQELLVDLFGVKELSEISAYWDQIPVLGTDINMRTRALCDWLAARVGKPWVPIQMAREELDGAEYIVTGMLVDDSQGQARYTDFLNNIHTQAKILSAKHESRSWL